MKIIFLLMSLCNIATAYAVPKNFYANPQLQLRYPTAFATMPHTLTFHEELNQTSPQERENLVAAIRLQPFLRHKIESFQTLSLEEQVQTLEELFELECAILNIIPPTLTIDEHSIPGYAFFEFNPEQGGPGKVFINKEKLKTDPDKTQFIALLIHETRHSAQFQLSQHNRGPLADGFRDAFSAQHQIKAAGEKDRYARLLRMHISSED